MPEKNKFNYYNVYKVFKSSVDKYNILNNKTIKTRIHDLRHSFITNSYKKLIGLNYNTYNALLLISKYVGHKGIKEVEYYIRVQNKLFSHFLSSSYFNPIKISSSLNLNSLRTSVYDIKSLSTAK